MKHNIKIDDEGCWIGDTLINEKVFSDELSDYAIRDKDTEVDNLTMWISESDKPSDKELMLSDLKDLLNYEGEFFLSSISTNDFIFPDDTEFDEICKKILKLSKGLK